MADYNVNMKQWNGTSFDNVLPLAYNAKQLGGQSLAEVKQWVQDNNLLLYTGQYVGNGTYGEENAINLTFDFIPLLFIAPYQTYIDTKSTCFWQQSVILFNSLSTVYKQLNRAEYGSSSGTVYIKKSEGGKTISFYGTKSPIVQQNVDGYTYWYAAIGRYDMGTVGA